MKYIYRGPISGVTLITEQGKQEQRLFPGREVSLPVEHPHVKVMEARGYLIRVKEAAGEQVPSRITTDIRKSRQETGSCRVKKDNLQGGKD